MSNNYCTLLGLVTLLFFCNTVRAGFYGLCYSPYTSMGICRSVKELNKDVALMLQHTRRIRLYSMECPDVMDALLTRASKGEISLLLGVWIESGPRDAKEMELLLSYLQKYPTAAIDGIVIGNEVIHRHQASPEYMAAKVVEAKQKVGALALRVKNPTLGNIRIFSVEETPNAGVVGVSDAVGVNIHPFYDATLRKGGDPDDLAAKAVVSFDTKLKLHKSKFPGKHLIVTEVGWPSNSDPYAGDHQTSNEDVQLKFVLAFLEYTKTNSFPYYWFEFKNADWKRYAFTSLSYSEYHFGLYNSKSGQKTALQTG